MPNPWGTRKPDDAEIRSNFWSHIAVTGRIEDCWPWIGKTRGGYGRARIKNRSVQAHRWAWESWYGPMSDELDAAHKCDNRPCCNPYHIFPATPLENVRDCIQKGRAHKSHGHRRGAKLTDDQVREIRARWVPRIVSRAALAIEYGVSPSTIQAVIERRNYANT